MILRVYLTLAAMLAFLLIGMVASHAVPPPDADSALAPWFRSLERPDGNGSCCSEADCRRTQYRIAGDHYEALIDEQWHVPQQWVPIPPDKILKRVDNPTGEAVLCWLPSLGVLCFVRPSEM